jgi:hypothetical protein
MIAIQIPKLEYKTISYTRLLSAEMPFADARHGAPYGEKNGPAIALAGAIGSISAGMAATSALLGGIMIAGGIATGLGVLTGNKSLMTIGAVAGLAGFGVGAFTGVDGGFMNPFSSAADGTSNFFNTVSGGAVKSVFSNIKSGLGITDSAAAGAIKDTAGVTGAINNSTPAIGSIDAEIASGASSLKYADGASTSVFGRAVDAVGSAAGTAGGKGGSGGLLNMLTGDSGAVKSLGGLADGYMKYQEYEQNQPLIDAKVDSTNTQTDAQKQQMEILAQRQRNMQFQPGNMAQVNQAHDVYSGQPGATQAGKIAVSISGEVKYVTPEEYNQIQQAKAGGGLTSQMGSA